MKRNSWKNKSTHFVLSRILSKCKEEGECWIWQGAVRADGYGSFSYRGRLWRVHRLVVTLASNENITGLCVDHMCRNRLCVNPNHLEVVTNVENLLRVWGK